MQTELGTITHNYFWRGGNYFRRSIPAIGQKAELQFWNGESWVTGGFCTGTGVALKKAA